ncbi:armadillo-type protein [Mycena filopes]|nr:armadillo-type protein [Mycena filopes]
MPPVPLLVPTVLLTGSIKFAQVHESATAKDVIDALLVQDGVKAEMLGDLQDQGWALQTIRAEHPGRTWEEAELEALGDGTLRPTTLVAPLVNAATPTSQSDSSERQFSSFPLTSHMHGGPVLRLVSLNPALSVSFSFLRVWEIHDGFQYKFFISKNTTVREVIDGVMEELGLAKTLPIPGGGNLEYVLEEVWTDGDVTKSSRLPGSSLIFNIVEFPFSANPLSSSARRSFRFCVPDEWYRRSKSRSLSSTSTEPSEATIRQLAALEEEDEDDGTAKVNATASPRTSNGDEATSASQNRLSTMFEGWLPRSPAAAPRRSSVVLSSENRRSIVSEPKLVPHFTGGGLNSMDAVAEDSESFDEAAFEAMLDDMGLKGEKRSALYNLAPERKRYLLGQSQQSKPKPSTPNYAASYGPASAAALLPRLVPQLTGDAGLMRRFSITAGWGAAAPSPPVVAEESRRSSGEFDFGAGGSAQGKGQAQAEKIVQEMQPIQPQSTGGRWLAWLATSGGDKTEKEAEKSAKHYVDGLRSNRADMKLVKHLMSLRVHVTTAPVLWIQEFVDDEHGLDILAAMLSNLVGKGGKHRSLSEIETTVLLEVVKCLRVLLNTEPGFSQVLASPTVITHIAYSLHGSSAKLWTLASELLGAICVLSLNEGHKAVLGAMSDFRVAFDESFRFQELIASLRLPDLAGGIEESDDGFPLAGEEDGIWDARCASMVLINALTNCPEPLEDRIMLRDEFTRRGLNEVVVALRYIKPPELLVKQLDLYTEEKFEDEQDMRDRARNLVGGGHQLSRSDSELEDLVRLAKQHGELYPKMMEIMNHYGQILQRDIGIQLKADLFTILDQFVQQAAMLDDFDDSWQIFMKRFTASVVHITGKELDVTAVSSNGSSSIVEQELEALRTKYEELSDERTQLRDKLTQQIAEMNTLKSLPLNIPVPQAKSTGKAGSENFHGLVQRLVSKEKEVIKLQAQVDELKGGNSSENREADERAQRERERAKRTALNEENQRLSAKIVELQSTVGIKDKEIIFLKRAMESVYTRFSSREELREEHREAEMDAAHMASRAIESLGRKDDEIASLCLEVADLKAKLAAKPKTEKEFKTRSAPPPPPPTKMKRSSTVPANSSVPMSAPPPPPPPPPPPRTMSVGGSVRIFFPSASSSSPATAATAASLLVSIPI